MTASTCRSIRIDYASWVNKNPMCLTVHNRAENQVKTSRRKSTSFGPLQISASEVAGRPNVLVTTESQHRDRRMLAAAAMDDSSGDQRSASQGRPHRVIGTSIIHRNYNSGLPCDAEISTDRPKTPRENEITSDIWQSITALGARNTYANRGDGKHIGHFSS